MNPEDVTFDDDKEVTSHDVTLIDVDGNERLVTIEHRRRTASGRG